MRFASKPTRTAHWVSINVAARRTGIDAELIRSAVDGDQLTCKVIGIGRCVIMTVDLAEVRGHFAETPAA